MAKWALGLWQDWAWHRQMFPNWNSRPKASTIEPLIQRCILSDSHITSNGWTAYANIDRIVNGIYIHNLINHKKTLLTKKIAMSIQRTMKICGCMQRWNSVVTLAHVHSSHLICMNFFGKISLTIPIYLFHFQNSVWKLSLLKLLFMSILIL